MVDFVNEIVMIFGFWGERLDCLGDKAKEATDQCIPNRAGLKVAGFSVVGDGSEASAADHTRVYPRHAGCTFAESTSRRFRKLAARLAISPVIADTDTSSTNCRVIIRIGMKNSGTDRIVRNAIKMG
jgi:hypothetical protein